MGINKQRLPQELMVKKGTSESFRFLLLMLILTVVTLGLNINTVRNYYSLDDFHIARNNPDFEQGIKSIPKIFVTQYSSRDGKSYGYRPLIRASFAIEYEFFGKNPHISHFINVVFYLAVILLLYLVLRRLLRNYHYLFPFLITLLFAAHPIHTEVVASLKNRDELFMFLFGLLSLQQAIRYADTLKNRHIYWALLFFFLAGLSKPTAAAFFFVIPLSLHFFTDLETKKVIRLTVITGIIALIAAVGPFFYLPAQDRIMAKVENPLAVEGNFLDHIAYAGYSLYYYLKLLIFPHPLRYYYGFNMFPAISLGNIVVILSILVHLGLFAFAIWKLKQKNIFSYIILVYLTSIVLFTNLFKPVPGIIAERFLLIPSLAFCMLLVLGIFHLFLHHPEKKQISGLKIFGIIGIVALILIPYGSKTMIRNKQWRTEYTLYKADMPYLYDSFKGNDLYANEIMKSVNRELAKPVNVLKFVDPQVKLAISHWERAIEILPEAASPYRNLGIIYSRVYKEYDTAVVYFNKTLEREPDDPLTYFNLGLAYEGMKDYGKALENLKKSIQIDSAAINARSRLANIYYGLGEFKEAIRLNQEIMSIDPDESLPYVNIGNYYIFQKDTLNGIKYYERAVELGAPADASVFLAKYYRLKGNTEKMNYYSRKADEISRKNAQ
ncbi:MAG TPA: tetratricopeptide repeat protein [Bacteroidales bacterium]|nr:tetratricopeptide repeat protein [Bacteroidales bacterium]HPI85685.1 tetratricopeptide repeat protein [Bacteroidales bacterium]